MKYRNWAIAAAVITAVLAFVVYQAFQAYNYESSRNKLSAAYDWRTDCSKGNFAISSRIPPLEKVAQRADLERFNRLDDAHESPAGPPEANVLCLAEFVLDPNNGNRFDSYEMTPNGEAIAELRIDSLIYRIVVSNEAIAYSVKSAEGDSSMMTAWQDSILDGRVDAASHFFVQKGSVPRDQGNVSIKPEGREHYYDSTYVYHLKAIMTKLDLPWSTAHG